MDPNKLGAGEREMVLGCALFRGVDVADVAAALADDGCQKLIFAAGETVRQTSVGLLLSGELCAESLSGTRRLYMRSLAPGSLFGVTALFGGDGQVSLLTAKKESTVLFFTEALLRTLMCRSWRAAENYIRFLSGRLRYLNQKIAFLAAGSVEEMLALRLLEEPDGRLAVRSYSALARELGVGRASLYRALDKLTENGLIRRNERGICILEQKKLEDMVK